MGVSIGENWSLADSGSTSDILLATHFIIRPPFSRIYLVTYVGSSS
jgi:hypothetical protein